MGTGTVKPESLKAIEKGLNCTFNIQKCNDIWTRAFVLNGDDVTIGRLTFRCNKLFSIKCYKRNYISEIDSTDEIFLRLCKYLKQKVLISLKTYNLLVKKATEIQKQDIATKLAWRKTHPLKQCDGKPEKHRRRITGRNVRFILSELITQWRPGQ